jgi:hypothetical protein
MRLSCVNLLFASFLFAVAAHAADTKCYSKNQITLTLKNKNAPVKRSFCYDKKSDFLINEECNKNLDCEAMKRKSIPLSVVNAKTEFGSSNHRACRFMKATPIIVKYKADEKKWKDASICLFSDDSFINLSYWMKYNVDLE